MFYSESQLSEILKCDLCEEKLYNPVCLPCGKTVCKLCTLDYMDYDKDGMNCVLCSESHFVPKSGFPSNEKLQILLKEEPHEICRSKSEEQLKLSLTEINYMAKELIKEMNDSDFIIKEYCMNLRNEVQLAKEQLEKLTNEKFDELLNEIDNFEKDGFRHKDETEFKKISNEIQNAVNVERSFYEQWSQYFKNFVIDENEIVEAQKVANKLSNRLHILDKSLKSTVFGGSSIQFTAFKNLTKFNILGSLNYIKIQNRFPYDYNHLF